MDGETITLEKHGGWLINELLAALLGYTGGDAGTIIFSTLFFFRIIYIRYKFMWLCVCRKNSFVSWVQFEY